MVKRLEMNGEVGRGERTRKRGRGAERVGEGTYLKKSIGTRRFCGLLRSPGARICKETGRSAQVIGLDHLRHGIDLFEAVSGHARNEEEVLHGPGKVPLQGSAAQRA